MKTLIKKTQKEVFELIKQYTDEIKPVLGEDLKKVILYGSYARGDFNEESDIDILLMVGSEENINDKDNELVKIEVNINLNNDVLITPIIINEEKFSKYKEILPFYKNIINEGVVFYEQ